VEWKPGMPPVSSVSIFKVSMGGENQGRPQPCLGQADRPLSPRPKNRVVLMNLATKQGAVYVDGKKLEGPEAAKAIEAAYGAYINDFYWLAMPWNG